MALKPGGPPDAARAEDAPVFLRIEGETAPRQVAPCLAACPEDDVAQHEDLNATLLAQGVSCVSLRDGWRTRTYPVLRSGRGRWRPPTLHRPTPCR